MGAQAWVGGGVCCVLIIVISVLIGVSFSKLEPNEVGLDYSSNSKTIDTTTLYQGGTHFLGVGHSFIRYPKNVQELREVVDARTADGLHVEIDARALYRLRDTKESLGALYLLFGEDHTSQYQRVMRSVVRDVAAEYTAFQFATERGPIIDRMKDALTVELADFYAIVDLFSMTNYELPAQFSAATLATEAARTEFSKVQFESDTARAQIATRIKLSVQEVKQITTRAAGEAAAYNQTVQAELVKIDRVIDAEITAYKHLTQTLGFSADDLINYVWLDTLNKAQGTRKLLSINSPKGVFG